MIRAFEMTGESTTVTVVSDRAHHPPWGLDGGNPGGKAQLFFYKRSGARGVPLPIKMTRILKPHEVIEIRTAGGGGYGPPARRDASRLDADLKNGLLSQKYLNENYPQVKTGKRKAGKTSR